MESTRNKNTELRKPELPAESFGDFDAPAPEAVTEHYLMWDWAQ